MSAHVEDVEELSYGTENRMAKSPAVNKDEANAAAHSEEISSAQCMPSLLWISARSSKYYRAKLPELEVLIPVPGEGRC